VKKQEITGWAYPCTKKFINKEGYNIAGYGIDIRMLQLSDDCYSDTVARTKKDLIRYSKECDCGNHCQPIKVRVTIQPV
jgi:hypothetical protein